MHSDEDPLVETVESIISMNRFQYFCNYFYVVVFGILPSYLCNCPSLLKMFSVFQDLLKRNSTTVSVSPLLRPICKFTDRLLAKHRGNLGEIGTPTEDKLLAKEYQTEFIRVCSYYPLDQMETK